MQAVLRERHENNISGSQQMRELDLKCSQMNVHSSEVNDLENVKPPNVKPTGHILKRHTSSTGLAMQRSNDVISEKLKRAAVSGSLLPASNCQHNPPQPPQPEEVMDIDGPEAGKPMMVASYACDIYSYLFHLERETPIKPDFLTGNQVTHKMRAVLVDWLIQVHSRFQLMPETLYITLHIVDRFLQVEEVRKSELQLVGVTAMLIASKYEEIQCPEVSDFVVITDNTYSRDQIIAKERHILKTLNFNLNRPFALAFLRRFSKAGDVKAPVHQLAKYLIELTFTDYTLAHVLPSEVAAAALHLALSILAPSTPWGATLHHYSRYSEAQLESTSKRILHNLGRASSSSLHAVYKKFCASKFSRIALNTQVLEAAKAATASETEASSSQSQ